MPPQAPIAVRHRHIPIRMQCANTCRMRQEAAHRLQQTFPPAGSYKHHGRAVFYGTFGTRRFGHARRFAALNKAAAHGAHDRLSERFANLLYLIRMAVVKRIVLANHAASLICAGFGCVSDNACLLYRITYL